MVAAGGESEMEVIGRDEILIYTFYDKGGEGGQFGR